ncbi:MAG: glycosyltransferase family 9 protein, partial [Candidatus Krumholzibacteria bacterium]|nr:glycosyltransferase family 9 protein [Candidatus Krumholzibacteria bacterium]
MAIPFLSVLRRTFPNAFISVACSRYVSEIFRRSSFVDRLIDYGKGLWTRLSVAGRSRPDGGWDICFVFPRSFSSALTARMSGARRRVGYGGEWRDFLLTDVLPGPRYRKGHLSGVYMRLLERVTGEEAETPLPVVVPPYHWKNFLDGEGIESDYFILAPGATYGSAKVWPQERYSALAERVERETGWRIVVIGSSGERS